MEKTAEKPKERIYYFNTSKVPGYRKEVAKKESELELNDMAILLGKLMQTFNEMPYQVQFRFAKIASDALQQIEKKQTDENTIKETGETNTIHTETTSASNTVDGEGK